jgi:hypothetical protein
MKTVVASPAVFAGENPPAALAFKRFSGGPELQFSSSEHGKPEIFLSHIE